MFYGDILYKCLSFFLVSEGSESGIENIYMVHSRSFFIFIMILVGKYKELSSGQIKIFQGDTSLIALKGEYFKLNCYNCGIIIRRFQITFKLSSYDWYNNIH